MMRYEFLITWAVGLLLFTCLFATALAADAPGIEKLDIPIAAGPFEPTRKSLGDGVDGKAPAWFREGKIGLWLHWGPQAMGRSGDWYAKFLYYQHDDWTNRNCYANHIANFGHPSKVGYKDVLALWKPTKWDPAKLMDIYKKAGVRYVLAMGVHHDNFDLWNSKYQPWNATRIGPKRDIVAGWQHAAKKEGIRFGVSFHMDYSWWWWQCAFMNDTDGPLKGVPYDAAVNYDGQDTWWKKLGLNLKDLYGISLADELQPAGSDPRKDFWSFVPEELKNKEYARWYCNKWYHRVQDVVDNYKPDFIYFDGNSYPFSGTGTGRGIKTDATTRIIAHHYNASIARSGKLEVMAFTKGAEDARAVARASESGFPEGIKRDQPWMYENGLGEWFYQSGTYHDSSMVIHSILEAVARDGNYTLNIPLTPEGELDPGGLKTLEDMGAWLKVNGAGIYGSKAWDVWREGTVTMGGGNLNETHAHTPYTAADIRFTVGKDGALYAYAMAWPEDGKLILRTLAIPAGKITDVRLLGSRAKLAWQQTDGGLVVTPPAKRPCDYAYGLKVTGVSLKPAP